jgi:5-methylcytosine-specific restriction endonuclease McrA
MIPLVPVSKPKNLSDDYVRKKTKHHKTTGETVWGSIQIKRALLKMGRNKCAYCECNVSKESKYLEVEHLKPKSLYPDDVLQWDNLLPSCKRCNGRKGNHDVVTQPIVNPRYDLPNEHLKFRGAYLFHKSPVGETTKEKLKLNDPERLLPSRIQIAEQIDSHLEEWQQRLLNVNPLHPSEWPRLQHRIAVLLDEAGPWRDYSAFTATYLLMHSVYAALRSALVQSNHWTNDLSAAEQAARDIALFP